MRYDPKQVRAIFITHAENVMKETGCHKKFQVDDNNRHVLNQLYYWIVGDAEKFNGNIDKGILLNGSFGCGKTVIMQAFVRTWNEVRTKRIMKYATTLDIAKYYHDDLELSRKVNIHPGQLQKTWFVFDDLGKEPATKTHFGSTSLPMIEILANRNDTGVRTFATSNYTLESLGKFYGQRTGDVMRAMFNVITLKGNSRREL